MTGKNLITLTNRSISKQRCQTVDARELHEFLGVGRDFSNWIKGRIDEYGFEEKQDFVCSPKLASKGRGGQNRIDYALTLDMAKELCMVEKTDRGKEARKYFIECERKLLEKAKQKALPKPKPKMKRKANEFMPEGYDDDPIVYGMAVLLKGYCQALKTEQKISKMLRKQLDWKF